MTAARSLLVPLRVAATALWWAVIGVAVAVVLAVTLPYAVGARPLTVLSGSMEPALSTGDVVVDEGIAPLDAKVGDVVTFPDPDGQERLITHRVREVRANDAQVTFTTKGDANNAIEHWSVPRNGRIGRALYRVPKLGYAVSVIRTRNGQFFLFVIPALALGAWEIVRIWRPQPKEQSNEAPA